jgi:ribonuclease P protein component
MLAKKARLTAVEVREILKSGRSVRTATLSAKYRVSMGVGPMEVGKAAVVISKKVAKTAVLRNRLRRVVKRILCRVLPRGVQVVFFLHKPLVNEKELELLCLKLS